MIRSRLSDIVKSGPNKLSTGIRMFCFCLNTCFNRFCTPACCGISKSRTLLIFICQYRLAVWEMIDSTALYNRSSLTSINDPFRMIFMVVCIIFLSIVISGIFYDIRTFLCIFPRHIVRTNRHFGIVSWVVFSYFFY